MSHIECLGSRSNLALARGACVRLAYVRKRKRTHAEITHFYIGV